MLLLVCFQVLDAALFQQQKHHQIAISFAFFSCLLETSFIPYFKKELREFAVLFRINGALRPTPRSQVTIVIKHEKLFFEITPCDSELNGRRTTSSLNGVQKPVSRY